MKFVRFKKFIPTQPETGQGMIEGSEMLLTNFQVKGFSEMPQVKGNVRDYMEFTEVPEKSIYKGEIIHDGETVGFYYPGGLGDAACHTGIIAALKNKFPQARIRIFARPGTSDAWFQNPTIEDRCARPAMLNQESFSQCRHWLLGDAVVYKLQGREQPNIYDELAKHFHIELKPEQKRPWLFVSKEEVSALWTRLSSVMKRDMRDEALLLFSPLATKTNRSWPEKHWLPFVNGIKGYNVLAIGGGANAMQLRSLAGSCHVLMNFFTTRELIVLAHEADRIVTVDSALAHLGAAFAIPTVALYGPFAPAMRVSTYPACKALWRPHTCKICPCGWHDDGFPPGHTMQDDGFYCSALNDITPSAVLDELMVMEKPSNIICLPK